MQTFEKTSDIFCLGNPNDVQRTENGIVDDQIAGKCMCSYGISLSLNISEEVKLFSVKPVARMLINKVIRKNE